MCDFWFWLLKVEELFDHLVDSFFAWILLVDKLLHLLLLLFASCLLDSVQSQVIDQLLRLVSLADLVDKASKLRLDFCCGFWRRACIRWA